MTTNINICLMPPPDVALSLVKLAGQLPASGRRFVVDGDIRLPHLTLFSAAFPLEDREELLARLARLPRRSSLECISFGVSLTANGYVEVGYNRTTALEELQVAIAATIGGLQAVSDGGSGEFMSEAERTSSHAYGHKLFGDPFRPHVTLGAFEPSGEVSLPLQEGFDEFNFIAECLFIGEADGFGAVTGIVHQQSIR